MINTITKYVSRQTFVPPIFTDAVGTDLGIVVTIPALAEPDLLVSLNAIKHCDLPKVAVEVIVVINHSDNALELIITENNSVFQRAKKWANENSTPRLKFLISEPVVMPKKHAGAGLARKIAMDEAVVRLQSSEITNPIIACFDADATCSKNYLTALWEHFELHPKSLGCSINFEHPLDSLLNVTDAERIIQYELHLRYYQAAMVYAGHPYAEFTVGSSMAVTRDAYVLQGGMNRRKAGEDFWFMLKLIMAGDVSAITKSTVYPSSRESNRVPFGTGRAITEMKESGSNVFYTSSFESFKKLKVFLAMVPGFYDGKFEVFDTLTKKYLESVNWMEAIDEIKQYTTDYKSFEKRFYRWFNSFMVMKFFHFIRDEGVLDVPVLDASKMVLILLGKEGTSRLNAEKALQIFRHKKRVQSIDYTPFNN